MPQQTTLVSRQKISLSSDPIVVYQGLLSDISKIFEDAKDSTMIAVNKIRNRAYWLIGERIVEVEQNGAIRAQYGARLMERLSRDLNFKYSYGFSESNLRSMRKLYLAHPNQQPAAELTWSHHQILLRIKDDQKRAVYEQKAIKENWSKRTLKRVLAQDNVEIEEVQSVQEKNRHADQKTAHLSGERGYLSHYRIIAINKQAARAKKGCGLALDCGFKMYLSLSSQEASGLKEGAVVRIAQKKKGTKLKKTDYTDAQIYTYKAYLDRVIDGDTLLLTIDTGFGFFVRERVRLKGIDTPARDTNEGTAARKFVEETLKPLRFFVVKTYKNDKYDRYLADVFYLSVQDDPETVALTGRLLNQDLLDHRFAKPYV